MFDKYLEMTLLVWTIYILRDVERFYTTFNTPLISMVTFPPPHLL